MDKTIVRRRGVRHHGDGGTDGCGYLNLDTGSDREVERGRFHVWPVFVQFKDEG